MPYNPETGKFEYGSHWDGVNTKDRKGSPFKQSKLSHRKWKKRTARKNARHAGAEGNGKDRYGVSKTKRDGTKKTVSNPGGSRSMKGKSSGQAMYLYNKKTGDYTKTTKAQVKKKERSAGVGSKQTDSYKLVSKNTFERAQRQGAQKPSSGGSTKSSAARKKTPRQLRTAAGLGGSRRKYRGRNMR